MMSSHLSEVLTKLVNETGLNFQINNEVMTNEQVFSEDGALPLFTFYAELLAKDAMGEGNLIRVGAEVKKEENGLYGVVVHLDTSVPESVQLMLIKNAIIEYVNTQLKTVEMKNFDDIKKHIAVAKLANSKNVNDDGQFVLSIEDLAQLATKEISPDDSIRNALKI